MKIWGNTVSTNMPRSDYNQTDPEQASFILNKPDKAIEKAQRTAEEALTSANAYTNEQIKKARPYNILNNSDFTNPLNTNGQTSYSNDGYCFDRWIIWHNNGCNVSYDSQKRCVRISSIGNTTLYQRLPKGVLDQTKKYTQAYGLTDGGIVISTRIDYSPENYDTAEGIMLSPGETLEIVWVALYEGEYTIDTLPQYEPKGRKVEELNCGALTVHKTATLSSGSWSASAPYTQTITVEGISAEDAPHVSAVYSDTLDTALSQKEAWEMVSRAKTANGDITFYCFEDKPSVDIPIQIEVNR